MTAEVVFGWRRESIRGFARDETAYTTQMLLYAGGALGNKIVGEIEMSESESHVGRVNDVMLCCLPPVTGRDKIAKSCRHVVDAAAAPGDSSILPSESWSQHATRP